MCSRGVVKPVGSSPMPPTTFMVFSEIRVAPNGPPLPSDVQPAVLSHAVVHDNLNFEFLRAASGFLNLFPQLPATVRHGWPARLER